MVWPSLKKVECYQIIIEYISCREEVSETAGLFVGGQRGKGEGAGIMILKFLPKLVLQERIELSTSPLPREHPASVNL